MRWFEASGFGNWRVLACECSRGFQGVGGFLQCMGAGLQRFKGEAFSEHCSYIITPLRRDRLKHE